MSPGPVAVVVVTYNSAADLASLLPTIPAAVLGVPRHRLIVVDNDSSDGSVERVRSLAPEATVLQTGANLGYAAAINVAMRHLHPDEDMLVLNADIELAPGSVSALAEACTDPEVGVAAPTVRTPDGHRENTVRRWPTVLRTWGQMVLGSRANRIPALGEMVVGDAPTDVDWVNGAAMMVPSRVRRLVGPWRADLFLYGEEVDFCRRVTDLGLCVRQVGAASAVHRGGDVARNPALWAQMITNRVVDAATALGPRAAAGVWAALVVGQLLRLPLNRGTHQRALSELLSGRAELLEGRPTNPAAPPEFVRHLGAGPR